MEKLLARIDVRMCVCVCGSAAESTWVSLHRTWRIWCVSVWAKIKWNPVSFIILFSISLNMTVYYVIGPRPIFGFCFPFMNKGNFMMHILYIFGWCVAEFIQNCAGDCQLSDTCKHREWTLRCVGSIDIGTTCTYALHANAVSSEENFFFSTLPVCLCYCRRIYHSSLPMLQRVCWPVRSSLRTRNPHASFRRQ